MPVPTTATAAAPGHKGPSAAQRLAALQAARKRTADRMANNPAVVEVAPPTALPSRSTPSVTTVALAAADEGPMKPAFKEALLAAQEDFELQGAIEAIENTIQPAEAECPPFVTRWAK